MGSNPQTQLYMRVRKDGSAGYKCDWCQLEQSLRLRSKLLMLKGETSPTIFQLRKSQAEADGGRDGDK